MLHKLLVSRSITLTTSPLLLAATGPVRRPLTLDAMFHNPRMLLNLLKRYPLLRIQNQKLQSH
jgi:hypothetical protein